MKKECLPILLILSVLLLPFFSAEIVFNQQPNEIYNLGDSVTIPVTIKAVEGITGIFSMDLICGTKQTNFYKNGVNLPSGEEKTMEASLVLTKEIVGEYTGKCKIKAILLNTYKITEEFKISNVITLQPNMDQKEFAPEERVLFFGNAVKENGHDVNGFIDLEIVIGNSSSIIQPGTINDGVYSLNVTFPEKLKAGNYLVKLNAYEVTADGAKTNKGFVNYNIKIKQIPTSLELHFENSSVEPGTEMKVMAILHDQTGDKIASRAIISVKKGEIEIQNQTEIATDEYLKFPIAYNEPPSTWNVFALSNFLTANAEFEVIAKTAINVEVINETIKVTNIGNVPFNDSISISIGNDSQQIPVYLDLDKSKEYELKAPTGEYEVEVLSNGESKLKQNVALTGRAIQVRDLSESNLNDFYKNPFVWIFVALILAGIIFVVIRKRNKKYPYGTAPKKKVSSTRQVVQKANIPWENRAMPVSKDSRLETKNKANLSISITGNQKEVSIANVKIKNLGELRGKKTNVEEPLQKIINIAENKRAFVYENQDNLFFILTPSKTKSAANENAALEIAQNAKEILSTYNRVAKNKVDFGIGIESGMIVEKVEGGILEFMSLGNLMTTIKRISSNSQGEVFLGEQIRKKLTNVRTEKQDGAKGSFHKMKDIKYHDSGHSEYMNSFINKAKERTPSTSSNTKEFKQAESDDDSIDVDAKSLIKGFY